MKFLWVTLVYLFEFNLVSCAPARNESSTANITSPAVTRGAYLQMVTHESVVIRWRTDVPSDSKVLFGTSLSYGSTVVLPKDTTEHVVLIKGLNPGTIYYYAIGSSSEILQGDSTNKFVTAPLPGQQSPVRVWVTGDFGVGSQAQFDVRDSYKNYSKLTTNLWIWLGDNAYASGTDSEYQSYVFDVYPEQLKGFPLYPAPGNHDYGNVGYQSAASLTTNFNYFSIFSVPQMGEAGGYPSGTPKYYSYNYSNVHFIALDSYGAYNSQGSPMFDWLVKDLSLNTQRWTIVYFHHPPYTKGTHNSDTEVELIDMRTHIIPLLEAYKVDMVLNGHSHVNERSFLLKGHYGPSTSFDTSMIVQHVTNNFQKKVPYSGTIYAVCGTSGQYVGPPMSDAPIPCMYFNDYTTSCSMVLDVNGDNLTGKYLSAAGEIKDEFTITKIGPDGSQSDSKPSCEISYHPGDGTIFFSIYTPSSTTLHAGLYNLAGAEVIDLKQLPTSLSKGYHVESFKPDSALSVNGVYLVKVQMGTSLFSKKIFIKADH